LSQIGADAAGGVTRTAFTQAEAQANERVVSWLRELQLTVAADRWGNLFASSDGNDPAGVPWLAGSHLDTVPNGGRLDGALGVVAAVEAIAAMRQADAMPPWPVEEPVRYAHGKVGSLLFSGAIEPGQLTAVDDGTIVAFPPPVTENLPERAAGRAIGGCLELHIEQGRRLERAGRRIGVVTAVASPIRLRIVVAGRADHSGATPMDDRRDALVAAAQLVLAIESAGRREAGHESVATAAQLTVSPGAMNVVPGAATLLVDVRGIDGPSMARVRADIETAAATIATDRELRITVTTLSSAEPTRFDEAVVAELVETAEDLDEPTLVMPSGAGHDAQCLALLAPAGMIFVPSIDGISHSPLEQTADTDVITGARVLAAAWATAGYAIVPDPS
jgi:hydantoinase/carbamoylase family amidase